MTTKSCLLLTDIPVQKQRHGPKSALQNQGLLAPKAWSVGADIKPELIIWGAESFCQCRFALVCSSSVGSYDLFASEYLTFFLKDSVSAFILSHFKPVPQKVCYLHR